MAALRMPEQLVKLLYSCPVCQGKERCQHQQGPTSSCSSELVLQQPPCCEHSSCHPSLSTLWLLAATVWPCPCNVVSQVPEEWMSNSTAGPSSPKCESFTPHKFAYVEHVYKTSSLSTWVTALKLMYSSPMHKFKPLYTRPIFFPY